MRYLTFLFSIALFTQCVTPIELSSNYQNHQRPALRLSDLPTLPHNRPVPIYLEGALLGQPYIEVFYLEAQGEIRETYGQITEQLRTQAKRNGVDAVIIQRQGLVEDRTWSSLLEQEITTTTKQISATGIIFSKNLDFVTKIPKKVEIYNKVTNSENLELICTASLDLLGNITEQDGQYTQISERISKLASIENRENAICLFNKDGQITQKVEIINNIRISETTFFYDSLGRLESASVFAVAQANAVAVRHSILMRYDEQGRLHGRDIRVSGFPNLIREIFKFDAEGRAVESNLYTVKSEELTLISRSVFTEFYTVEDIKQMYPERGTNR